MSDCVCVCVCVDSLDFPTSSSCLPVSHLSFDVRPDLPLTASRHSTTAATAKIRLPHYRPTLERFPVSFSLSIQPTRQSTSTTRKLEFDSLFLFETNFFPLSCRRRYARIKAKRKKEERKKVRGKHLLIPWHFKGKGYILGHQDFDQFSDFTRS